jgi:hypothetical protein
VKATEYEGFLRRFEQRKLREEDDGPLCRELRAKARALLQHPDRDALLGPFPSARQMTAAARRHLDVTLGLEEFHLRLGPVALSGVFRSLDEHLRCNEDRNLSSRDAPYVLFVGFEIPVSMRTGGRPFRTEILVDEDDGRWRCRSSGISRKAVEEAIRRPTQRVVVVTVANQRAADRVVRAVRPHALHVYVQTQEQQDKQLQAQVSGALHGPLKFRRLTKAQKTATDRLLEEMGFGAETPL